MYRKIEDFLGDWEYETEMTAKVFENLKEEHLNHSFHTDNRTLGRLAWLCHRPSHDRRSPWLRLF